MPRKLNIEEVRQRVKEVHGDGVVLDESTYANTSTKARFIDKDYGEWWALPSCILSRGQSHPSRRIEKTRSTNMSKYGVGCVFQSDEIKQKIANTNVEKYGVVNVSNNNEIQNKKKATFVEKYGVENPFQDEGVKEQIKEYYNDAFGVDHPSQIESVKEKKERSSMEKYGTKSPMQDSGVWKKSRQTCLEKYGVEYPAQTQAVKKKIKLTCLERYGVDHPSKHPALALQMAKGANNSHILYHWKTREELVCIASYEKAVVEYLNENKIDFKWQHKAFTLMLKNGKESTYRPDLYLIGKRNPWIEIKGYFRKDAKEKWDIFHTQIKPNSQLWDKAKLKKLGIL